MVLILGFSNIRSLFWGNPRSLQMVIAAMKLKDSYSLCSARCPNPSAGREKAFKTMQFTKREVYY